MVWVLTVHMDAWDGVAMDAWDAVAMHACNQRDRLTWREDVVESELAATPSWAYPECVAVWLQVKDIWGVY